MHHDSFRAKSYFFKPKNTDQKQALLKLLNGQSLSDSVVLCVCVLFCEGKKVKVKQSR